MSPAGVALICGSTRLSSRELEGRVASWRDDTAVDRSVVPLRSTDLPALVVAALGVRRRGGVPAIGDARWSDQHWARLCQSVAGLAVPDDAAWATFSSGSTGSPRVILRSEASWSTSFESVSRLMDLRSDDVVLLPSPLVSSLSLFSIAHLSVAGSTVLLPSGASISARDCGEATLLHGTPVALERVLDLIDAGAPTMLRLALIGGAHLEPRLRTRAEAAGIRVVSYYGAAELSFVAVDDDGSGLKAFGGVDLRVTDGELWSRSPYAAMGYLAGGTGSFVTDADGWSSVGDLADLRPDGILTLRGRRDGAILSAAATVLPEDVEVVLRTLDGVKNSVVFGAPHPRLGALVCAVIEPDDPADPPTSGSLRSACRARLGVAQVPRRWYLAKELPVTPTGKPARAAIARDAIAGRTPRLD